MTLPLSILDLAPVPDGTPSQAALQHIVDLARLGDDLLVVSTVEDVRAASVLIHQQVRRGHELLASADITAAFLGPGMRPRRQPKAWVERFDQLKRD